MRNIVKKLRDTAIGIAGLVTMASCSKAVDVGYGWGYEPPLVEPLPYYQVIAYDIMDMQRRDNFVDTITYTRRDGTKEKFAYNPKGVYDAISFYYLNADDTVKNTSSLYYLWNRTCFLTSPSDTTQHRRSVDNDGIQDTIYSARPESGATIRISGKELTGKQVTVNGALQISYDLYRSGARYDKVQ